MTKIRLIIIGFSIICSGLFLSQCKKYPEDDVLIQWKRPEKRLIKYGPWVFEKLTVDGIDKSAEFRADSAYFNRIEFWAAPNSLSQNLTIYETNGYPYAYGIYDFSEDSKILKLSVYSIWVTELVHFGPIFRQPQTEWKILRMSKKGVTLQTNFNSSEYILELKSQN